MIMVLVVIFLGMIMLMKIGEEDEER